MKVKEAVEAMRQGKKVYQTPSDPPVDLCDHLYGQPKDGYFQLCHQDKVMRLVPTSACAAEVKKVIDLEKFASAHIFAYVNFEIYAESE